MGRQECSCVSPDGSPHPIATEAWQPPPMHVNCMGCLRKGCEVGRLPILMGRMGRCDSAQQRIHRAQRDTGLRELFRGQLHACSRRWPQHTTTRPQADWGGTLFWQQRTSCESRPLWGMGRTVVVAEQLHIRHKIGGVATQRGLQASTTQMRGSIV